MDATWRNKGEKDNSNSWKLQKCVSPDCMIQSLFSVYVLSELIHQRNHLSFILFHTGLYIAVRYFEYVTIQITAYDHLQHPCILCLSRYSVGLCCISRCGVVIIFFIIVFFPTVGVPFCILAFFCKITGWECKGGDKSCSGTFIFMWSKQWEGALLWCTNLVIVSWLEMGFYMALQGGSRGLVIPKGLGHSNN